MSEPNASADTPSGGAIRRCWCGTPLLAPKNTGRPRATCSDACRRTLDFTRRKVGRRQRWVTMWLQEQGLGTYSRAVIRREVAVLRTEIAELLAQLHGNVDIPPRAVRTET